jgi:opacity protein-like surface antigen
MVLAANSEKLFMKRTLLTIVFVVLMIFPAVAQVRPDFDADLARNTLRAEYGALIPASYDSNQSYGLFSLSYTRRYSGRWGWRTGMQYAQLNAPVDHYVGLPFSAVYRFTTSSFDGRLRKAWNDSLDDLSWDGGGDVPDYEKDRMRNDVVSHFFSVLFRRTELYAGLTPGYLLGDISHRFTCAADAGVTLSIPVGRFSLDITPGAHYLFTKNVMPVRWVFTVSGGLSFLF